MAGTRWVVMAVLGDGPLEDGRVYGPWRSKEKADRELDRLLTATDGSNVVADTVRLQDSKDLTVVVREFRALMKKLGYR